MNTTIFILLVIFQVKHLLADYPLQTTYMLNKGKSGLDWIIPLLAHTVVHAAFTFVIVLVYTGSLTTSLGLALFDLVTHFVMDRVKASPNMLGRYKPNEAMFWTALGFDQFFHHCIGIIIVYLMMR